MYYILLNLVSISFRVAVAGSKSAFSCKFALTIARAKALASRCRQLPTGEQF